MHQYVQDYLSIPSHTSKDHINNKTIMKFSTLLFPAFIASALASPVQRRESSSLSNILSTLQSSVLAHDASLSMHSLLQSTTPCRLTSLPLYRQNFRVAHFNFIRRGEVRSRSVRELCYSRPHIEHPDRYDLYQRPFACGAEEWGFERDGADGREDLSGYLFDYFDYAQGYIGYVNVAYFGERDTDTFG